MENSRKHTRIDICVEAEVEFDGNRYPATTLNVSQGGASLETDAPLHFNARVIVRIALPGVPHVSAIPAVVRWVNDRRVGVQFESLRPIDVWGLGKLIRR